MFASTSILIAAASIVFDVPLTGTLDGRAIDELRRLPGIERVETRGRILRLAVEPGEEVRVRAIDAALRQAASRASVDRPRIGVSSRTIFELNAGQCFFCAEQPLGQTLERRGYRSWAVVDYEAKGRLRFRVDPAVPVDLKTFGGDDFEDVVLTARYDGAPPLDLYWPTGGIAWRPTEEAARREATASKMPLMIFPTAGT